MEVQSANEKQETMERIIWKFLQENKELVLRKITGAPALTLTAETDKDINLNTYGTGKALYNGIEIGAGGAGSSNKIVGFGCSGSTTQPTVECSPIGAPCEIHVTAGKTGKIVFKRSA